jgi:hypothetical protein
MSIEGDGGRGAAVQARRHLGRRAGAEVRDVPLRTWLCAPRHRPYMCEQGQQARVVARP